MGKIELLSGERFGKMVVIEEAPQQRDENGKLLPRMYLCRCDCGTYKVVSPYKLLNGHIRSCGCSQKKTPEGAWKKGGVAPCPYPSNSCRDSRVGRCCRECPKEKECSYACLNSPDRCGRDKVKT